MAEASALPLSQDTLQEPAPNPQETSTPPGAPGRSGGDGQPAAPSAWGHWELLALATLGATFGFLTGVGLYSEIHAELAVFIIQVSILGLAAYVLFDPLMDFLYEKLGALRSEIPESRKVFAAEVVAGATVLISAFHHSLGQTLGQDLGYSISGLAAAALALCCIGLSAFFVTHAWVRAAKRGRAALSGAFWGAVGGLFTTLVAFLVVRFGYENHSLRWLIPAFLLALFWFGVPGFFGGLVVDKRREPHHPTRHVLHTFALASVAGGVLLVMFAYAFGAKFHEYKSSLEGLAFLLAAALIAQNVGWAAGPFFRHKSCDCYLDPSAAPAEKPTPGPRLVPPLPFPEAPGGGSSVPTPAHDDVLSPAERARILILQPKGDRLWASVALVLALVTAGLAYYAGSLRRDPEIVVNIEQRFQQDSGLYSKALIVRSTDRVVTLAGRLDDEIEHAKAVQEAASVRGVRQVIDQIQVAPPAPPSATSATVAPGQAASPGMNATVSIVTQQGTGAQKQVGAPKAATAPKHGFFNFLKKKENNQNNNNDKNNKTKTKPKAKANTKTQNDPSH
jgi:hypothetical protein